MSYIDTIGAKTLDEVRTLDIVNAILELAEDQAHITARLSALERKPEQWAGSGGKVQSVSDFLDDRESWRNREKLIDARDAQHAAHLAAVTRRLAEAEGLLKRVSVEDLGNAHDRHDITKAIDAFLGSGG